MLYKKLISILILLILSSCKTLPTNVLDLQRELISAGKANKQLREWLTECNSELKDCIESCEDIIGAKALRLKSRNKHLSIGDRR